MRAPISHCPCLNTALPLSPYQPRSSVPNPGLAEQCQGGISDRLRRFLAVAASLERARAFRQLATDLSGPQGQAGQGESSCVVRSASLGTSSLCADSSLQNMHGNPLLERRELERKRLCL